MCIPKIKFLTLKKEKLVKKECAVFPILHAIAGIASLVPLCYHDFVVILWVLNFFLGYFVGPKLFFLGISCLGFSDCKM